MNRCKYYIWSLLGVLPPKQSFRRGINVRICLGWGIMCCDRTAHCSGSQLFGPDVWVPSASDHWYDCLPCGEIIGLMSRDDLYCARSMYGWHLYDFWWIHSLSRYNIWHWTWMCKQMIFSTRQDHAHCLVFHPYTTASRSMV
jgi:hypothetical protein